VALGSSPPKTPAQGRVAVIHIQHRRQHLRFEHGVHRGPLALAALITLVTYVAAVVQLAVALRSWNGLNWRSQGVSLHTPPTVAVVLIIPSLCAP
jgi:hypothetical protein